MIAVHIAIAKRNPWGQRWKYYYKQKTNQTEQWMTIELAYQDLELNTFL